MAEKQPVVIEMSTNLQTGVTACLGVSGIACRCCGSQNTRAQNGEVSCLDCRARIRA